MISRAHRCARLGLLGFLTVWAAQAHASTPLGERYFESVGDAEVIPNNVVTSLAQDQAGFIWIGTSDGLIRFDGYRFRHFGQEADNPVSLSGDFVRCLLASADGRLWVGTNVDGLSVFDPATEHFQRYRHDAEQANSLSSDTVRSLVMDGEGRLWIGTRDGLDLLAPGQPVVRQRLRFADTTTANDDYIAALLAEADGTLWVGSWNGLARRDPQSGRFDRWFVDGVAEGEPSLAGEQVQVLLALGDGRIALGTNGRGSFVFDPKAASPRLVPLRADASKAEPLAAGQPPVLAMLELGNDQLWLGAFGGIDVFDRGVGRIVEQLRPDPAVTSSLANDQVRAMLMDRAGQVWVGGYGGGLQRHDPNNRAVRMLRHSPSRAGSLSAPSISSVLEHHDGSVWIGTRGAGIDILDRASGRVVRRIEHAQGDPGRLRSGAITALAQLSEDETWVGTLDGLHRLDAEQRVLAWFNTASGLPNDYVRRLQAGANGELWIATDAGLARWDPISNSIRALTNRNGDAVREDFNALALDAHGRLWAGSSGGLYAVAAGADRLTAIPTRAAAGSRALHPTVLGLLIDQQQRLWIDTPAGMGWSQDLRLELDQGIELHAVPMPKGIASQPFGANLLADARGRIWTQSFMFDPEAGQTFELGRADGVDLGTPWFRAYTATHDGLLLFGGSKGLLVLDPKAFVPWRYTPPLVWTEFSVDGQTRPAPAPFSAGIELLPGERGFALEFAALDYSAPQRNRYAYRLAPYDADWIEVDAQRRFASYAGLSPGRYVLHVRGSGRSRELADATLQLPVSIRPAYWQTPWFAVLVVCSALTLLAAGQRWYTLRMRRRAMQLEHLVEQRTAELLSAKESAETTLMQLQTAQDELVAREKLASLGQLVAGVAHEINTPVGVALTASSYLGDRSRQIEQQLQADRMRRSDLDSFLSQTQEASRMIESNLARAAELVRNFKQVSVDRSSDDRRRFDLAASLTAVVDSLRLTWKRRPIQLTLNCPPAITLDSYPGALGQVITNLIQNALLHAFPDEASTGHMRIDVDMLGLGQLVIRFADDGRGIAAGDLARIFEPFYTTRRAQGGSGLGLHIVFNLVTAKLGGRITVRSEPGAGTVFEMRLPLSAPL